MAKGADEYGSFGSVPDDTAQGGFAPAMQVKASPAAFGTGIGEAVTQAAEKAQEIFTKQRTMAIDAKVNDTLANVYGPAAAKIEQSYYQLHGKAAVEGQQAASDSMIALQESIKQQSTTMEERIQVGNYMQSHIAQVNSGFLRHADTENNNYQQEAHEGLLGFQAHQVVAAGSDLSAVDNALNQGEAQIQVYNGEHLSKDQGYVDLQKTKFRGAAVDSAVSSAIERGDLSFANQLYENNKDKIDPDSARKIDGLLRVQNQDQWGMDFAVAAVQGKKLAPEGVSIIPEKNKVTATPLPPKKSIVDAIYDEESSSGKNAKTSVDGAIGPMQIMPGTFKQYALAGENINNPEDNKKVGKRILDDANKKFPNDPARAAVFYHSGEGNVSPIGSPDPWKRDVADGNGKHVSQYVSDILGKMGVGAEEGTVEATSELPVLNKGINPVETFKNLKAVQTDYENYAYSLQNPKQRKAALTGLNSMYARFEGAANRYSQGIVDNAQQRMADPNFNYNDWAQKNPNELAEMMTSHPQTVTEMRNRSEAVEKYGAKQASRITDVNSPNFYGTIKRVLQPYDMEHPNGIYNQGTLNSMLGVTDGNGINMKDYKDGVKALGFEESWKKSLLENMDAIEKSGGNIDGKGQERAIQFYEYANKMREFGEQEGTKGLDYSANNKEKLAPMFMLSRMEQIRNAVNVASNTPPPQIGDIVDGWGYVGGDPADQKSWVKQ